MINTTLNIILVNERFRPIMRTAANNLSLRFTIALKRMHVCLPEGLSYGILILQFIFLKSNLMYREKPRKNQESPAPLGQP